MFYGMGVLIRKTPRGFNMWHGGAWRWRQDGRDTRFGAYFATYDTGYTVVTNYSHEAIGPLRIDLDKRLYRATHPNQ